MTKICSKCGDDIPQGRLKILPNTTVCVKCSDTQPLTAVTVCEGTGDHTWNETVFLNEEQLKHYKRNSGRNG